MLSKSCTVCLPTLALIAHAVFLFYSADRQTDRHRHTVEMDNPTHALAAASLAVVITFTLYSNSNRGGL